MQRRPSQLNRSRRLSLDKLGNESTMNTLPGYRRSKVELRRTQQIITNHKRVAKTMKELAIQGKDQSKRCVPLNETLAWLLIQSGLEP